MAGTLPGAGHTVITMQHMICSHETYIFEGKTENGVTDVGDKLPGCESASF